MPVKVAAGADTVLAVLRPVERAVAAMCGPSCEVIRHDLRAADASIAEIADGHVSGRSVVASLVEGPLDDIALKSLLSANGDEDARVYETRTRDGRRMKSTTVIYRDRRGAPVPALCINCDISAILAVQQMTAHLLDFGPAAPPEAQTQPARRDVSHVLAGTLDECLAELRQDPARMSRAGRVKVVRRLNERGVFLIRGAAYQVGCALGVSQFTVYTYLESIRNGKPRGGAP